MARRKLVAAQTNPEKELAQHSFTVMEWRRSRRIRNTFYALSCVVWLYGPYVVAGRERGWPLAAYLFQQPSLYMPAMLAMAGLVHVCILWMNHLRKRFRQAVVNHSNLDVRTSLIGLIEAMRDKQEATSGQRGLIQLLQTLTPEHRIEIDARDVRYLASLLTSRRRREFPKEGDREFALALLAGLEAVGGREELRAIRWTADDDWCKVNEPEISTRAAACAAVIEDRLLQESDTNRLLRPAEYSQDAETLLRPVRSSLTDDTSLLLRPAGSDSNGNSENADAANAESTQSWQGTEVTEGTNETTVEQGGLR